MKKEISITDDHVKKYKSSTDRVRKFRERQRIIKLHDCIPNQEILDSEKLDNIISKRRRKTNAEYQKEYRKRKKLERVNDNHTQITNKIRKTNAENQREYRLRKNKKYQEFVNTNPNRNIDNTWADFTFTSKLLNNKFGFACDVCDRLWFEADLKLIKPKFYQILKKDFPTRDVESFKCCYTCTMSLTKDKIPKLSTSNGFVYPEYPKYLPKLNVITERLISPRLPFMHIRRLRHVYGNYGIIGQVINVPVDVINTVQQLPRSLDDDFAINVSIKRKLYHKSSYLKGQVKKSDVEQWLNFLLNTPLYKQNGIVLNNEKLQELDNTKYPEEKYEIEEVDQNDEDMLTYQQQTMLWSEDKYLCLAPGQKSRPISLLFDEFAEELSFPAIYLGQLRKFKKHVKVTPYSMATSELRRKDRRGVTPQHLLYMAMKILRLRVNDGINHAVKCIGTNRQITRKMIESEKFLDGLLESNLAFLKSIPNSASYWHQRKSEVFAMMRQLGKPTVFLTLSACEPMWSNLLQTLYRLRHGTDISETDVMNLTYLERADLINEDPVTCSIYFNKLVDVIMGILQHKTNSPFGKHYVVDYFQRIEFQHRGSPHAHILLWLNDSVDIPLNGENSESFIQMIERLCSVDPSLSDYSNFQRHKHTFTCYKRCKGNQQICRFEAPFWPMSSTQVLIPMPFSDNRRENLLDKYKKMHKSLEFDDFNTLEEFLEANNCKDESHYLDILRAGITRPRIFLKRNIKEIFVNNFNPWISSVLKSNMDIQFITEEYSCAAYVVEYVNKSNRGISNLYRKLIELQEEYPDMDITKSVGKLSVNFLNTIEMSAQESAWYLLRQPMSFSTRKVEYIPTVLPNERRMVKKTVEQLNEEQIDEDSTNIWKENIFEKYENRGDVLENVSLAEFVAYYYRSNDKWLRRQIPKVIRYRGYKITDNSEYQREMVTLHLPFTNEEKDILENNKFLNLYKENEVEILRRRKMFESNLDIEKTMEICKQMCIQLDTEDNCNENNQELKLSKVLKDELFNERNEAGNDDIELSALCHLSSIVRKRENVMLHEEFCKQMRLTNEKQRALLLEVIYRLINNQEHEPLQVFLTGPAGCGKTFVIKLLMEILNKFSKSHSSIHNAYISCASTGKAAVAINGTTVHSAFNISIGNMRPLSNEKLHNYQYSFENIDSVIIDEVSMISAELLNSVNSRLQQITANYDYNFGNLNLFLIGDLRQLPPVRATPIFKSTKSTLVGPILWRSLKLHLLTDVVRQSDKYFSEILTKVGDGETLTDKEIDIISTRFVTKEDAKHLCPNGVRLFFNNKDVQDYNLEALSETKINAIAIDDYDGYNTNEQLISMRNKVHKMTVGETSGLPYNIPLLIDKPYMITTNIDVVDGLVNGAIGQLKFIETDIETGKIIRLWLIFDEPKIGGILKIKYKQHRKVLGIEKGCVPILPRTSKISFKLNRKLSCKRIQFPLISACALTIHKSQGGTFDEVVYDYDKSHEQQLVYVALSRVKSLEGLYLTNVRNEFKFYHSKGSKNKDIRQELHRLHSNQLETLQQSCLDLIRNQAFSIVSLNTQSLKAHSMDISTDFVMKESKFLMLNETWMENNEHVEIENFKSIVQYKRENQRSAGVAIYQNNNSTIVSTPHIFLKHQNTIGAEAIADKVGDICGAHCVLENGEVCFLVAIYISNGTKLDDIKTFIYGNLMQYSVEGAKLLGLPYDKLPIIFAGDFNLILNNNDGIDFRKFMKEKFNMDLMTDPNINTTRNNTTIDGVFSRELSKLKSHHYVSYFSHHTPIVSINA